MIDTPIWNKIGSVLDDDLSRKIRPAGNAKGRRKLYGWVKFKKNDEKWILALEVMALKHKQYFPVDNKRLLYLKVIFYVKEDW